MTRLRMQDIAARAGVSQPTVSLVLSGRRDVRIPESTRQRILDVARELNYRRDGTARNLAAGQTHAVAFVFDATAGFLLDDPFCRGILAGVIEATQAARLSLLFSIFEGAAPTIPAVEDRLVDGVLYLAAKSGSALDYLVESRVPFVVLNPDIAVPSGCPTITLADRAAGQLAGKEAAAAGHRSAVFVLPSWQGDVPPSYAERLAGFRRALPGTRDLVLPRTETPGASYELGLAAVPQIVGEPLVVCANDQMAWGLVDGLAARGVRIPTVTSVIGFDGLERDHDPHNLTIASVGFDRPELGRAGLRLLQNLLTGGPVARQAATARHIAPPQWIAGASLARVAAPRSRTTRKEAPRVFAPRESKGGSSKNESGASMMAAPGKKPRGRR